MKIQTSETPSGTTVIGGSAIIVPVKAVIWTAVVVIGILLGGYVMLFGWLAGEVVSLGKGQAALAEAVERNDADLIGLKEGQVRLRDDMERGFDRFEDILRGQDAPE